MFDTSQDFLDFVNANGGSSKVAMLIFNNSYTKVYGKREYFNPTTDLDTTSGLFKFIEYDIRGLEYVSYKSLAYLEGITFAGKDVEKDDLNFRNYRP